MSTDPISEAFINTIAAEFSPKPNYDRDPTLWAKDKFDIYLWGKQREIMQSLIENRYTAVRSCHDAGKSFSAGAAVSWWIDTKPLGEAFVVSTAPTAAQVSAILWREITRLHNKGNLPGKITSAGYPQWKLANGELVGYGRKPAEYSDSAFQGIHAMFPLIVLDEACGIPKSLWDAVDALATNSHARVLAIGNPDNPSSQFMEVCKPDSGWNVIHIDGLRTPNFTREAVQGLVCKQCAKAGRHETLLQQIFREERIPYNVEPVPERIRPLLLSPEWVEERLHRWVGRPSAGVSVNAAANKSSLFTSKVRGNFPSEASEGVIPLGWVQDAQNRWNDWQATKKQPQGRRVISADVARQGADETGIAVRQGDVVQEVRKYRLADTMETTGRVAALLNTPDSISVVDVIGVGAGVVDRLREMDMPVIPFNAAKSGRKLHDRTGEFTFQNHRAAAWWNLRELLDPSRDSKIALPPSEMLAADLTAPRWKVLSGGVIQIEGKDDIRKRLGRSTDEGDAVVGAFWVESEGATDTDDPDAVPWIDSGTDLSVERWLSDSEDYGVKGWSDDHGRDATARPGGWNQLH